MIPYRYINTKGCEQLYPVYYTDYMEPHLAPDKPNRYLVLHEVPCRYNGNWNVDIQWPRYKGLITWNPIIFEEYKDRFNMVFSDQFQNMRIDMLEVEPYIPLSDRQHDVCCVYGPPASRDTPIMMARYDLPLFLSSAGMSVNAYGTIPNTSRPEFRPTWSGIFSGPLPAYGKRSGLIKHKFSVAFENSRHPRWAAGWVTEKIYDCLGSGTVPIYWGAPDVTDYIPPEVFIDYREFDTNEDLYKYLTTTPASVFEKMSKDGVDFFNTVHFDKYLDVYENLP